MSVVNQLLKMAHDDERYTWIMFNDIGLLRIYERRISAWIGLGKILFEIDLGGNVEHSEWIVWDVL